MATHGQVRSHFKEEPVTDLHHPHHQQQGHPPSQQLQHSRPPSIVHQQHHPPTHPQQQPPPHHQSAYSSSHSLPQAYQASNQATSTQDNLNYYNHPSPYSTPGATSGYTSADTSDMMAAAQMSRPPYPPIYHTPQSNSPASVASPSQHDQHRSIYGQPPSQHLQQSMYYQPQPHYQSMPPQAAASPYAQHAHHAQQSMTSQPNMMMSHTAPQNQMTQHAAQHAQHAQHAQAGMTSSPRPKIEPQVPLQLQKQPPQPSPMPQAHHQQSAPQLQSPANATPGVNPNAAPGPIPATTPLVVRQDGNGVQWIAFEYSRDRVKMEYTIRCDVESVNIDELSPEFKQENCVYPRACCPKEQYRGNRLMYETDCNRVGWALAQLNAPLRGKRGLIQRAVDSWRNSNQDPRLRSRRVRRMAKMNSRKQVQGTPHPGTAHMPGPSGPTALPAAPAPMGPGGASAMGKPTMGSMGQPMHHHHAGGHPDGSAPGGGDEVGESNSFKYEEQHLHHHQAPTSRTPTVGVDDVRQAHVLTGYAGQGYPVGAPGGSMSQMVPRTGAVPTGRHSRTNLDDDDGLFPKHAAAMKRKFVVLHEDGAREARHRVRVALKDVNTEDLPDSFRRGASVFPDSFFAREMQSRPPSATGSRCFPDDLSDDGTQDTEGRGARRGGANRPQGEVIDVKMAEGGVHSVTIPRMTKANRVKEVRLNELGYRMAWLQSRVFAGKTVLLQRALDVYRNKTRTAIESTTGDVQTVAPHFETRVGKRRWQERMKRVKREDD